MPQRILSVFVLIMLCAAVSGCGLGYTLYQDRRATTHTEKFRELRLGMSTSEVLSTVGRPDRWDENHWVFERYFDATGGGREFRTVDLFFKQNQLIVAEGIPGGELARIDRSGEPEPLAVDRVEPTRETAALEEKPEPRPMSGDTRSAETAIRDWAAAWAAQDVDSYLAAYVETYAPKNMTHEAWARQRRERVSRPASIDITLEKLAVRENGPGSATVTFEQLYRSDRYSDRTPKAVDLRKVDGQWRITGERSGRVAYANGRPSSTGKAELQAEPVSVRRAVEGRVNSWVTAWMAGDVEQYLAHYSDDYAPAGSDHASWVSQRRRRLTKPDKINIQLDELLVRSKSENRARATFRQTYSSERYRDRVTKTLEFERIDGEWKIVSETSR